MQPEADFSNDMRTNTKSSAQKKSVFSAERKIFRLKLIPKNALDT